MEELIFRTKVETGKSAQDVDNLKQSLSEVGTEAQKAGDKGSEALAALNKKVAEGSLTMREAAQVIKQYTDLALQAGSESPIGQQAIANAAQLKSEMGNLQKEINNAGVNAKNLQASLELGSTIAAGYGALQGVMALTGSENEALAQTFVKLQAVQSVLTGIEQVRASLEKESLLVTKAKVVWSKVATAAEYVYAAAVGTTTGAMKALRIAMLSLPIVAIIAGIVALVAALASFMSAEEKAEEQNKALNASFEKHNEALEANSRAYKRNADNKRAIMVSENASAQELFEFDKQRLKDEEMLRKKNVKMLQNILPQKTAAYRQALNEENWELAKTIREETKQMRKKYKDFRELDGQYAVDRKVLENNYQNDLAKADEDAKKAQEQKAKEWNQKQKEKRAAEAQKRLDEQKLLEDLLIANIADANTRRIAQMKLQHERELAEVKLKYGENSKVIKELETKQATEKQALLDEIAKAEKDKQTASSKALLEGRLIEMRSDFEAQQTLKREQALADMNEALAREGITDGEKYKIKQEYNLKIADLDKERADLERRDQKALLEGKILQEQQDNKDLLDAKLSAIREDFEQEQELKKELALFEMEEALLQQDLTENEKFKIRQEYLAKIDAINQESADKEKQRQKDIQEAGKQVLQMGLDASQNLADAFFDYKISKAAKGSAEELKLEKKKFEINKKLQVAQAIMQGVQATQAAFASGSAIPVVGVVTGPLFAAAAAAASALNIAKIKSTTFESNSTNTSTPSATTPSVNVPEVQGQDTVTTQTQGLQGSAAQQITKVVMVDSELKASLGSSQQVSIVSNVG
jgi:hypothetical protein